MVKSTDNLSIPLLYGFVLKNILAQVRQSDAKVICYNEIGIQLFQNRIEQREWAL